MPQEYGMPKCCISCESYDHKGYTRDEWQLMNDRQCSGRSQYGSCEKHHSEVFATEICNIYEQIPGVTVVTVINRPVSKEVRQERLF